MIFDKNNLVIADICAKDESRPEISGVLFKKDRTIATDSYTLIEVKNNEDRASVMIKNLPELPDKANLLVNFAKKGYIIPVNSVKKILSNLPAKQDLPALEVCRFIQPKDLETSVIATYDTEKADVVMTKNIVGDYPSVNSILDPAKNYPLKVIVDIKKLKQVVDVIAKMNLSEAGDVEILIKGEFDPFVIKAKTENRQEVHALVMPIRK